MTLIFLRLESYIWKDAIQILMIFRNLLKTWKDPNRVCFQCHANITKMPQITDRLLCSTTLIGYYPVHGANMGSTCDRQDPGGPHVGHMNLAIWVESPHKERVAVFALGMSEQVDDWVSEWMSVRKKACEHKDGKWLKCTVFVHDIPHDCIGHFDFSFTCCIDMMSVYIMKQCFFFKIWVKISLWKQSMYITLKLTGNQWNIS